MEVVSYQHKFLETFVKKISAELHKGKIVPLPKRRKLFSVLKSPFANKKAKEQFSLRKHKKLVLLEQVSFKELKLFLDRIPLKNIAIRIKEYSLIR